MAATTSFDMIRNRRQELVILLDELSENHVELSSTRAKVAGLVTLPRKASPRAGRYPVKASAGRRSRATMRRCLDTSSWWWVPVPMGLQPLLI